MAEPIFSAPVLFTPSELSSQPALVDEIVDLVNDAFLRSKLPDPEKWDTTVDRRFPTRESYLEMFGEEDIVAVIFDGAADGTDTVSADGSTFESARKVVAVAGAIPWQGGWKKEGAGTEEGWEIKAVAVHGDAKYLRRGLAMRLYDSIEQFIVEVERRKTREKMDRVQVGAEAGSVTLWIMTADCINGVYWRKKGYKEVRRDTYGVGIWGCLTSFDLVVLKRDVHFEI